MLPMSPPPHFARQVAVGCTRSFTVAAVAVLAHMLAGSTEPLLQLGLLLPHDVGLIGFKGSLGLQCLQNPK